MGSLLVGIDLVQISKIGASMSRFGSRFIERVFTDEEIRYCGSRPLLAVERFAARFAAKEATMKVLCPLDEALPFRSIEVLRGEDRAPRIVLHDTASRLAARAHITSLSVSMSHEADYATAVVVAEIERPRQRSRLSSKGATLSWRRSPGPRRYRQRFGSER